MNREFKSENYMIINSLNHIVDEIKEGYLSVFAGAGLSTVSGYTDWKGLLEPFINELGIPSNLDPTVIAQYYKDEYSRDEINRRIYRDFSPLERKKSNPNLEILVDLPINTYWTTNYDSLIEDTIVKNNKIAEVVVTKKDFKYHEKYRDAIVYKMHGDRKHPDEAVITKSDYETYDKTRELFTRALSVDLVRKTFLFIGFSFSDPNLDRILGIVKNQFDVKETKTHYCFMKSVQPSDYLTEDEITLNLEQQLQYEQDKQKQNLKIKDMLYYGIKTILVNDFSQITKMLQYIHRKFVMNKVFISGSLKEKIDYNDDDAKFIMELAKKLILNGYEIVSGFGYNIGNYLVLGAYEADNEELNVYSLRKKIQFYPILSIKSSNKEEDKKKEIREKLIGECGYLITLYGKTEYENRIKSKKKFSFYEKKYILPKKISEDGVFEEFLISYKKNNIIIPVAFTNGTSRYIYDICKDNKQEKFFDSLFENLNNSDLSLNNKVDNIIELLNRAKFIHEKKLEQDLLHEFSKTKVFLSFHYNSRHKVVEKLRNSINSSDDFIAIEEETIKNDDGAIKKWIDRKIRSSQVTVLLLNSDYLNSNYLTYELQKSRLQNNPLLVITEELSKGEIVKFENLLKVLDYTNVKRISFTNQLTEKNDIVNQIRLVYSQ